MSYEKIVERANGIFDSAKTDYCNQFLTTHINKDMEFVLKFLSIQLAKMESKFDREADNVKNMISWPKDHHSM